jgi:hypothetical protein
VSRQRVELLLQVASDHYKVGRVGELPYLTRGDRRYTFDGQDRRDLHAQLREMWRQARPNEEMPSRQDIADVLDDLRIHAEMVDPDPEPEEPTAEEQAAELVPAALFDEHPERLKVLAGGRNPFDVARQVADYLIAANDPPHLFAMGSSATVLLRDDGTLEALDTDGWLAYVAERVDFLTITKDGQQRIVAPPASALKILPPLMLRELPQLDGVTATPYLDAAGNLIATDGYHPGSRLVLRMGDLSLPPVSDAPTTDEVAAAVELLTVDWLGDFPFATDADKANLVAELLTLTGREMFPLVPLFVHDASTSGSGKGLLLITLSVIATGQPPEVMELPGDGDEQRKTVTSVLLSGKLLVAWDELHVIAGRTLAAILTAEIYSGRILGVNKLATVRNKLVQIALGNNVEVRGDMKRRVVPSRLVPKEEHPEHRTDFRHSDLQGWVRARRGDLLAAAFTIWRHWIATGRKPANVTMGSFERWARTVGGALLAAGIPEFHTSTREWLSFSEDDDGWPQHLAQLRRRFDGAWFTVAHVAEAVEAGLLKRPPVKRDPEKELALQVAYAYRGQRERWHKDLRLVRSKTRDSETGGYTWSVQKRGEREDARADDSAEQDGPDSSSASSGWSEPQVTGASAGDHPERATEHLQDSTGHLQVAAAGESAGQAAQHEDAEHPEDGTAHLSAERTRAFTWSPGQVGAEVNGQPPATDQESAA